MSQRNVERLIGRLATDEAFRRQFAADPGALLQDVSGTGVELNECELWALARIDQEALARFAAAIDPRLQKTDLKGGCQ